MKQEYRIRVVQPLEAGRVTTDGPEYYSVGDYIAYNDPQKQYAIVKITSTHTEGLVTLDMENGEVDICHEVFPDSWQIVPDERIWGVAVYEQDKLFGGREEGGWWYNTGTLVVLSYLYNQIEMVPAYFTSLTEAQEYREKMAQAIKDKNLNEFNHEPGSVLCSGWYAAELHEGLLPTHYPIECPHYE